MRCTLLLLALCACDDSSEAASPADAQVFRPVDVAPDAPMDAAAEVDAARDAAPDTALDVGLDALVDAAVDGAPEASLDLGPDAEDAALDSAEVAELDAAPDAAGPTPPAEGHTELTADGRLALRTEAPAFSADCPECVDRDEDGLDDAWEALVLDKLRPLLRFDEAEQLLDDEDAVLQIVGRVAPVEPRVRVFMMLGYSKDYGTCLGITGHDGDSERVALDLELVGAGDAIVVGAYTAAHEGTINDHSRLFTGEALDELLFEGDEPRWVVFPSQDKHGTYASIEECESVSPVPCVDEDCAPDGVDDPERFDALPEVHNAGEEEAPLIDALDAIGFEGDSAWADERFCGGGPRNALGCSSPVREKLLEDPF